MKNEFLYQICLLIAYWQDQHSKYPTGTPHRIQAESTWILRRWVQNQISTNFQVVSTYFFSLLFCWSKNPRSFHILFWCNFVGQNIHIFSMFFFWCNFDCWKIHVVSTYFFDVISLVEKLTLLPLTFFDVIFMAKKSTLFARVLSTKFRWAKIRRRF